MPSTGSVRLRMRRSSSVLADITGVGVSATGGAVTGAGSDFFVGLTETFVWSALTIGSAITAAPDGKIVTTAAITTMPARNPIAAAKMIHEDAGLGFLVNELHLGALAHDRGELQGVPIRQPHTPM